MELVQDAWTALWQVCKLTSPDKHGWGLMQSPQDEKAALKEIHDMLCQHYELICQAFVFYPTGSSADVFHMGLNNFTALLEDCKVRPVPPIHV